MVTPQRLGGVPDPARIVEEGAGQRHHVGRAVADHRIGLVRMGDQPDRAHRHPGLVADPPGQRHLIAGLRRPRRFRHDAAARRADIIDADGAQRGGEDHRLVDGEAAIEPVGGADPEAERSLGRPDLAHRRRHFERIAHPVVEAAAIVVGAVIGERGQKLVQQIAMGAVDLGDVDPEPRGALRRGDEAAH